MEKTLSRFDPLLTFLALIASLVGLVAIWDAGYSRAIADGGIVPREVIVQSILFVVSLIAAAFVGRVPASAWKKLTPFVGMVAIVLCVLVEIPGLGHEIGGAKRWIKLGSFTVQPSEFAKVACLFVMASALSHLPEKIEPVSRQWYDRADAWFSRYKGLIGASLVVGICLIFCELGSDLGTAAVLGVAVFGVMVVGRAPLALILASIVFAGAGTAVLVNQKSYRTDRLKGHEKRWEPGYITKIGYQTTQSEIAGAHGGTFGRGFGNGVVKKRISVPTTDFLAATIAEEFGLVGMLAMILLLAVLSLRLVWRSLEFKGSFGGIFTAGVGAWIAIQTTINIMMVNGTIPPIGIPLPFLSAGGSSLIALWLAIGMCQSMPVAVKNSEDKKLETDRNGRRYGRTRFPRT